MNASGLVNFGYSMRRCLGIWILLSVLPIKARSAPVVRIQAPQHQVANLRASLLHDAIKQRRLDQLQRVLKLGLDVNRRSRENQTTVELTLQMLQQTGWGLDALSILLDAGANPNARTSEGDTPLTYALRYGLEEAAVRLINAKADLSAQDSKGNTPIHYAIERNIPRLFRFLLSERAGINTPNDLGDRPIHLAIKNNEPNAALKLILRGVNPTASDSEGMTPLNLAASKGYFNVVATLIDRGASPNQRSGPHGDTPLHIAARNGYLEMVYHL